MRIWMINTLACALILAGCARDATVRDEEAQDAEQVASSGGELLLLGERLDELRRRAQAALAEGSLEELESGLQAISDFRNDLLQLIDHPPRGVSEQDLYEQLRQSGWHDVQALSVNMRNRIGIKRRLRDSATQEPE